MHVNTDHLEASTQALSHGEYGTFDPTIDMYTTLAHEETVAGVPKARS